MSKAYEHFPIADWFTFDQRTIQAVAEALDAAKARIEKRVEVLAGARGSLLTAPPEVKENIIGETVVHVFWDRLEHQADHELVVVREYLADGFIALIETQDGEKVCASTRELFKLPESVGEL